MNNRRIIRDDWDVQNFASLDDNNARHHPSRHSWRAFGNIRGYLFTTHPVIMFTRGRHRNDSRESVWKISRWRSFETSQISNMVSRFRLPPPKVHLDPVSSSAIHLDPALLQLINSPEPPESSSISVISSLFIAAMSGLCRLIVCSTQDASYSVNGSHISWDSFFFESAKWTSESQRWTSSYGTWSRSQRWTRPAAYRSSWAVLLFLILRQRVRENALSRDISASHMDPEIQA